MILAGEGAAPSRAAPRTSRSAVLALLLIVVAGLAAGCGKDRRVVVVNPKLNRDVVSVYNQLQRDYYFQSKIPSDPSQFATVDALLQSLNDPYTFTVTQQQANQVSQGQFVGLFGFSLARVSSVVYVATIDPSGPAWKAGLRRNDVVRALNGTAVAGATTDQELANLLAVSTLQIDVTRGGQPLSFTFTRADYVTTTVEEQSIDANTHYVRIGRFVEFSVDPRGPAGELDSILARNLQKKRWIVDVRWNGGGVIDRACQTADLFLASGRIVTVVDKNGNVGFSCDAVTGNLGEGKSVVVLQNGGSASASEILASALRNLGGYRLVGETSFGKGVAQNIYDFTDGGQLWMVAYQLQDALGRSWHATGLAPDVPATLDAARLVAGEDTQLTAAIAALSSTGTTTAPITVLGPRTTTSIAAGLRPE